MLSWYISFSFSIFIGCALTSSLISNFIILSSSLSFSFWLDIFKSLFIDKSNDSISFCASSIISSILLLVEFASIMFLFSSSVGSIITGVFVSGSICFISGSTCSTVSGVLATNSG